MKRPLRPDEARLWAVVARTIRPAPGRSHPADPDEAPAEAEDRPARTAGAAAAASRPLSRPVPPRPPETIEPRRKHRVVRERDPLEARLDLHGLTQDAARAALHRFVARAYDEGVRTVLVITGRGTRGDGVLRRYTPEWLSDPQIRPMIAGVSPADRRHGGEGALYVALKRRPQERG
jgi:DNA-nicking Smr family endonuclease